MSFTDVLIVTGSPRLHPVSGLPHVEVPVLALSVGVATAVVLALLLTPPSGKSDDDSPPVPLEETASWAGALTPVQVAVRAVSVLLLALAVAAGRFGSPTELENLAPALVVGAGWPLLAIMSLAVPVWRWWDPWDAMARVMVRDDESEPPGHVWPAVVLATTWCWYVAASPRPLDPRAVGTALLLYTTVTLAGCLLLGRRRWLSSGEPLGIISTWVSAASRARLGSQGLPRGAAALLGATLGGMLFAVLRRSELWTGVAALPDAARYDTTALVASCAAGGALLTLGAAAGRRTGDRGAVLCAAAPALVGLIAALGLERNRLFISVQLLPGLLGDPFGAGWDLLGPSGQGLDADPLGGSGLLMAQFAALSVGLVWGALAAARRSPRAHRLPVLAVLGLLAVASAFLVAQH